MGKKHHYIPAMHLEMYSDDKSEKTNHEKKVGRAVLDTKTFLESGAIKFDYSDSTIYNLGAENKLYESFGSKTEELLADMEGWAKPILVKITEAVSDPHVNRVVISKQEYIDLGHYLLVLHIRHRLHIHSSITDVLDLIVQKSLEDTKPEDFGALVGKIARREIVIQVPIAHILVGKNPTPMCINMPFHIKNRQTGYPIDPFTEVVVHVEYPPRYSERMSVPIYREVSGEYDPSLVSMIVALAGSTPPRIEFVYPSSMEAELRQRLFDALDGIVLPKDNRRYYIDSNKKRGTFKPKIHYGETAFIIGQAINHLDELDHTKVIANKLNLNPSLVPEAFSRSAFLQQQSYIVDQAD
jgi:hypothetical protein